MAQPAFPRGIAPDLLVSQVKNTAPYLWDGEALVPPVEWVRAYGGNTGQELSHFEYFRLCVSAHYLTCATPVPTDVDNQIRQKLWAPGLPVATALQMARLVLESRQWDFTQMSTRWLNGAPGPWEKQALSGHLGEWFTLAAGAYAALGRYRDPEAQVCREELLANIRDEVNRHSEIFGSLWRAEDGLGCLKASANVSHNLGDLDRVMDMWRLEPGDPLRVEFYKLGVNPYDENRKLRHLGRLWVAGELYKSVIDGGSMSFENHRHFALRKPRCLRQKREFRIPIAPFVEDWARAVAEGVSAEDLAEVFAALQYGWGRLPNTVAYGRALRVIHEVRPEFTCTGVPEVKKSKEVLNITRAKFEARWASEAVRLMDEIPSRA